MLKKPDKQPSFQKSWVPTSKDNRDILHLKRISKMTIHMFKKKKKVNQILGNQAWNTGLVSWSFIMLNHAKPYRPFFLPAIFFSAFFSKLAVTIQL